MALYDFRVGEASPITVYMTADNRLAENVKEDDPHYVFVEEGATLNQNQANALTQAFTPSPENPYAYTDADARAMAREQEQ